MRAEEPALSVVEGTYGLVGSVSTVGKVNSSFVARKKAPQDDKVLLMLTVRTWVRMNRARGNLFLPVLGNVVMDHVPLRGTVVLGRATRP